MSDFRVLIIGSRTTTPADTALILAVLKRVCGPALTNQRPVVIIEGDSPFGGVDVTARQWASITPGVRVEEYPAAWHKDGGKAGTVRNQRMVDSGAGICLAFADLYAVDVWDCARKAVEAGIPARVYPIGDARD